MTEFNMEEQKKLYNEHVAERAQHAISEQEKVKTDFFVKHFPPRNKILVLEANLNDKEFLDKMLEKYPDEQKEVRAEWNIKWKNIATLVERCHAAGKYLIVYNGLTHMNIFLPGQQGRGFTPGASEAMRRRRMRERIMQLRNKNNPDAPLFLNQLKH